MLHDHGIGEWLMQGDPAIRWQTMRDLTDAPQAAWRADQRRMLQDGWGARLLGLQDAAGTWGGGIYRPKWTSTTYTLLTLCDLGIPGSCRAARRGARLAFTGLLGEPGQDEFAQRLAGCDRCVVGMLLRIGSYFGLPGRWIEALAANVLEERMPDGAWNCRRHKRPTPHHSSFHTTFNVLDGLREYVGLPSAARRADALAAEHDALEFMLQHRLFRSDKTGAVINPKFSRLPFPSRWHYDVLRGLSYFARCRAPADPRLAEAIAQLVAQRSPDGTWPVEHQYAGKVFFNMERAGGPSRWNTLRALRVLQWWEAGTTRGVPGGRPVHLSDGASDAKLALQSARAGRMP